MIEKTFVNLVESSIKENWNTPALSNYKGEKKTYGDTAAEILRLHKFFEINKIQKGDKIAMIGKNSSNWAVTYLAIASYGAVIVPLLTDFKPKDVHYLINHSESVLLFASDDIYKTLDVAEMEKLKAVISLKNYLVLHERKGLLSRFMKKDEKSSSNETLTPEKFSLPQTGNDELMEIIYTSGTSGFSKGVMLQHNSLAANVIFAMQALPLKHGDNVLSFLPLAHAYGCAFEFLYPFALGCNITFLGKIPSPQILIKAFAEIKPTVILCVPLIIEKIYKKKIKPQISKLPVKLLLNTPVLKNKVYKKIYNTLNESFGGNFHEVIIGGAALNKEVEDFLRKIKFKFTVGYGMTECGPLISYAAWNVIHSYSCGKAINFLEVKIDSGDPQNIPGEIMVKGENVMTGYYKNEVATNAVLKDSWLRTGDLGLIDSEGFIHIKGRSKSMILGSSGQNIYPEEIEAYYNNMPLVQESLVVERDGKLYALVFPDYETIEAEEISKEKLKIILSRYRKSINHDLPKYTSINKIVIMKKEFEKTPKKSIKRFLYTTPNFAMHSLDQE